MFSTRTSYFMKNPDIFILSLICRANIFLLRFKTLPGLKLSAKTTTPRQMQIQLRVQLNLIWYHFILNLEIRAWNLYFLNENVLHLNNKNKPCFLTRIIDFKSPKVAVLLFVNSQIGAFAFAKISCSTTTECGGTFPRPNEETNATLRTELWRDALLFLYPLELFNRGKRLISWLFCKVNSL